MCGQLEKYHVHPSHFSIVLDHAYEPGIPCPTCGGRGEYTAYNEHRGEAEYLPCPANCIQGWVAKEEAMADFRTEDC